MIRRATLFDDLAGVSVPAAAGALGLQAMRRGLSPCPCCGAERRGQSDPRAVVRVYEGDRRWTCSKCEAGGDAAALVLAVATGEAKATGSDAWAKARTLAEEVGLVGGSSGELHPVPAPARHHPAPPRFPPPAEVAAFWNACGAVSRCSEAVSFLERRGLDLEAIERMDLARVCPASSWNGWPAWAGVGRRSWGDGWRLVLPCFDAAGRLVTLRARWVLDTPAPNGTKEMAPRGFSAGPALYCSTRALDLLTGAGGSDTLLVVEGGPTWLRYAVEAERKPVAVVGLWAGAWNGAAAERLAKGSQRWVVATDDDEAGDRYAATVLTDATRLGVKTRRFRVEG